MRLLAAVVVMLTAHGLEGTAFAVDLMDKVALILVSLLCFLQDLKEFDRD